MTEESKNINIDVKFDKVKIYLTRHLEYLNMATTRTNWILALLTGLVSLLLANTQLVTNREFTYVHLTYFASLIILGPMVLIFGVYRFMLFYAPSKFKQAKGKIQNLGQLESEKEKYRIKKKLVKEFYYDRIDKWNPNNSDFWYLDIEKNTLISTLGIIVGALFLVISFFL